MKGLIVSLLLTKAEIDKLYTIKSVFKVKCIGKCKTLLEDQNILYPIELFP